MQRQTENTTYTQQKPATIQALFDSIAKRYDKGNAVLSFELHRLWNATLVRKVLWKNEPEVCLDLCCGTGDILFSYLKKQKKGTTAYMLDFSAEMLSIAKQKAAKWDKGEHAIRYIQADAKNIPLPDDSVDAITMAYGIRNVQNPAACTKEAFRVLKPGGTFAILELTRPSNPLLRWGHSLYLKAVLPKIAGWITTNKEAYEYLCNSINHFMPPEKMKEMLQNEGFKNVSCKSLTGGIATIVCSRKNG